MGTALLGLCICAVCGWNLWAAIQPGGEFPTGLLSPPADHDHPIVFWSAAAGTMIGFVAGLGIALYSILSSILY